MEVYKDECKRKTGSEDVRWLRTGSSSGSDNKNYETLTLTEIR